MFGAVGRLAQHVLCTPCSAAICTLKIALRSLPQTSRAPTHSLLLSTLLTGSCGCACTSFFTAHPFFLDTATGVSKNSPELLLHVSNVEFTPAVVIVVGQLSEANFQHVNSSSSPTSFTLQRPYALRCESRSTRHRHQPLNHGKPQPHLDCFCSTSECARKSHSCAFCHWSNWEEGKGQEKSGSSRHK